MTDVPREIDALATIAVDCGFKLHMAFGLRPLIAASLIATTAAAPTPPTTPQLPDPVQAGWHGHKVCEVLVDNPQVRTARCTFPPGEGHERHFHAPHWGYVLAPSTMRITTAKGTVTRELKAGDTWWSDGVAWHEVLNVGTTTGVYLIVEPKGAAQLRGGS